MSELLAPKAIIPIDHNWAIDEGRARHYVAQMEGIDFAAAAAKQEEWMAGQLAEKRKRPKPYMMSGETALVYMSGPMTKEHTCMSWLFGGCSTVETRGILAAAGEDDDVKNVLLVIDSPGGQVAGTADLADDIARLAKIKHVEAFIEDLGASAAYWAGSQASWISANKSAVIGSLGVVMAVADRSKQYADAGVKIHVIATGDYKGAGIPGTEIEKKHLDEWKDNAEAINNVFLRAVAKGRGMKLEDVRKLADGRVHIGAAAQKLGLVDEISSLDAILSRLSSGAPAPITAVNAGVSGEENMAETTQPTAEEIAKKEAEDKAKKPSIFARLAAMFSAEAEEEAEGGVTPDNRAAAPAADNGEIAGLKAKLDGQTKLLDNLQQERIQNAADAFIEKAIHDQKALPAEKEALRAAFITAGQDDLKMEGTFLGTRTKALVAIYDARPATQLLGESIAAQLGEGNNAYVLLDASKPQEAMDALAERTREWAAKNPQGGKTN